MGCTGCFLDPYKNDENAVSAVDAWFNYTNGDDDLGATRRKAENINIIKNTTCKYVTNDDYLRYVYECKIFYTPIGETLIPLAKDETIDVYVVISYNDDRTFNYVVYHSGSENDIWKNDDVLNYGKPRK